MRLSVSRWSGHIVTQLINSNNISMWHLMLRPQRTDTYVLLLTKEVALAVSLKGLVFPASLDPLPIVEHALLYFTPFITRHLFEVFNGDQLLFFDELLAIEGWGFFAVHRRSKEFQCLQNIRENFVRVSNTFKLVNKTLRQPHITLHIVNLLPRQVSKFFLLDLIQLSLRLKLLLLPLSL